MVDVLHIQHEFSFFSNHNLKSSIDIFFAFLRLVEYLIKILTFMELCILTTLELLPKNYQLAVIRGPHPEAKNLNIERVLELSCFNPSLKDRIRITEYVNQETADLYHAATDICLAPYHGNMSGSGALG